MAADEMNRRLAGMAEAFFERGIRNYIGAGWPVDDIPAVDFASIFYITRLEAKPSGSRWKCPPDNFRPGSTWAQTSITDRSMGD